jgi:ribosomal protein S18 acetylase RimI-like enzyme
MIKLRAAKLSDYIEIAKLHAENWRLTYRGIMSDNFLNNEVDKDRLDTWYKRLKNPDRDQFVTVANLENSIVGFCCLIINEDSIFGSYIDSLHVSAALQKSGIGKMMISHSAKIICENANSNKMYLWVYESNKNARIAYESLGATNYETIEKANVDGTFSKTCRYTWNDIISLI